MISFFPGPSKIYDSVPALYAEALSEGYASISHRSQQFMAAYGLTVAAFRSTQNLPADYQIFFTGSSTENWEILSQSLSTSGSSHLFSGAFGAKWYDYARLIHPSTQALPFGPNDDPNQLISSISTAADLICITQNETSNGTALDLPTMQAIRQAAGQRIVAVDVTSSCGGVEMPWALGDAWFCSVQKCFGMPAGLGLLVLSPAAIQRMRQIDEKGRYNSLSSIVANGQKNQNAYTPNVLAIVVLGKLLQTLPNIADTATHTAQRAHMLYTWAEGQGLCTPLVTRPASRSQTVVTCTADAQTLPLFKEKAKQAGFQLGNGYGAWKDSTFRIANFPAHTPQELLDLTGALTMPVEQV